MGLTAEVLESPAKLGPTRAEWDALAVATAKPFSTPAWALAWWDHMRPGDAQLRLVLVKDEGRRLVGVLPMFSRGRAYRPLGGGIAPVEPLAMAGEEEEVASAFASALAACHPSPAMVELERHSGSPAWSALLAAAWPGDGGGWCWTRSSESVPRTGVLGDYDEWFKGKSSSFRREMRRKQRRLEEAGGALRDATPETLEADVAAFLSLHRARLEKLGGTSLGSPEVEPMLVAAGRELLEAERFRLLMIDIEGESIAAQLVVSAGNEVCAWNTGFDEAHARLSPLMLCMLRVIEDAAGSDGRAVNLGPGGQDYKYRLCDDEESLLREVFVPRGPSYLLARLRLVPAQLLAAARRVRDARRG